MTARAGRALAIALLWLPLSAGAEDAPTADGRDPRLAEAASLLGDAEAYPRAIALYRAVLEDDGSALEARLQLARVLAWSRRYDEALAEYDALLALDPPPASAAVERAEVLSWSARHDEAERAFLALLERDPDDARAARGLARVYSWSGRAREADEAYGRALALEDDREARAEWAALRDRFPPNASVGFEFYDDDDGFRRWAGSAEGAYHVDLDTRVSARAAYLDLAGSAPAGEDLPERDRGAELLAGVQRRFSPRLEGELSLGARVWDHAPAREIARAQLAYRLAERGVLTAAVDHRDALDRSDSLAALESGIRDTAGELSLWLELGRRFEYWGRFRGSWLSDSNQRGSHESSLSWRPWGDRSLRLDLSGSVLAFADGSDLYYDPDVDFSFRLGATHRTELPGEIRLDLVAGGGFGYARQDGGTGMGPAFDVGASLSRPVGHFRFAIGGSHAQSRRQHVYRATRATATLGLDF